MWHILPYNVEVVRESVFRGPIGAARGAGVLVCGLDWEPARL